MNLNDVARLKGCTLKGRTLETSCGCSAVDSLLGGAVPISAFLCVDEVKSRGYSESLAKYFIAEGLYSGHDVLVVDPMNEEKLWNGIPSKVETQPTSSSPPQMTSAPPEDLRIAFRYTAKPKVNSSVGEKNRYDLGKPLNLEPFASQRIHFNGPLSYEALYKYMATLCRSERHAISRGSSKNLLRVVINHLGSPVWSDSSNFSAFLVRVRALLRKSYVVLLATSESETMFKKHSDELLVTADACIQLIAISEEEQNKLSSLDRYHGYLRILRLPRLTSVGTYNPPVDLVFTQKRNTFDVSILHLPPALGDDEQSSKLACNIDF